MTTAMSTPTHTPALKTPSTAAQLEAVSAAKITTPRSCRLWHSHRDPLVPTRSRDLFERHRHDATTETASFAIDALSETAHERHYDEHHRQQSHDPAWAVAPSTTMRPRRNDAEQQQDEDDNQDGWHLRHL